MREETASQSDTADYSQSLRRYSPAQELTNNLPYIAMIVLGVAVLVVGFVSSPWRWPVATAYLTYGIVGVFWIILFLCPFCRYYGTRSCPCGYGRIAARLRKQESLDPARPDGNPVGCFGEKFKKHIPVIVPLWFIPILVGVPVLVTSFSVILFVLMIVFALDAFVILPLFSTRHGCKECPQQDSCPWMRSKRRHV